MHKLPISRIQATLAYFEMSHAACPMCCPLAISETKEVLIGQAQDAHDGKKTPTKRNPLQNDDLPNEDENVPLIPSVLISKDHESHDGDNTPTQRNSLEDDDLPDEYADMFTLLTKEMVKCCIRAVAKSHRKKLRCFGNTVEQPLLGEMPWMTANKKATESQNAVECMNHVAFVEESTSSPSRASAQARVEWFSNAQPMPNFSFHYLLLFISSIIKPLWTTESTAQPVQCSSSVRFQPRAYG
ncbi:hypothetical protein B0H13DRAFT_1896115 [Mycena leptocephala]|nr:hypothetical protein B0H13DRAFT_1896108 [Mycena leptocephala]KAJ7870551.1 hypothetical protein B0H13DRAFT_1896115 [Mycena leptocephala]